MVKHFSSTDSSHTAPMIVIGVMADLLVKAVIVGLLGTQLASGPFECRAG